MLELATCWLTRAVIAHHLEGKCAVDRLSSRSQEQIRGAGKRLATAGGGITRVQSLIAMLGVTCLCLSLVVAAEEID